MGIRSTTYVVDMAHYSAPGYLGEQGVGRPVLELRDTWGRFILLATKALINSTRTGRNLIGLVRTRVYVG